MPEGFRLVCQPRRDFSIFWDLEEWYVIHKLCSPLRWAEYGIQVHFQIKWDWLSLRSWNAWTIPIGISATLQFLQFLRSWRMVRDLQTTFSATLRWIWRTGTFPDQMGLAIPKIVEFLKDSDSSVRKDAISAFSEISKNGTWSIDYVLRHVELNTAYRCIPRSNGTGYP